MNRFWKWITTNRGRGINLGPFTFEIGCGEAWGHWGVGGDLFRYEADVCLLVIFEIRILLFGCNLHVCAQ